MKKNDLSNTLRTTVNRSLRAIKNSRFPSLILVQTLEPGTQKSKGIFTTDGHPATNGKVERVNRVIKSLLRRFVNTSSWASTFGEEASNNEIDDEEFQ